MFAMFNEHELVSDDIRRSGGEQPVQIYKYPVVHYDDIEPVSIIQPDIDTGPWIAGGACIKWFNNLSLGSDSDIDVFCRDKTQANKVIKHVKRYHRFEVMADTKNAVTIRYYSDDDDNTHHWLIQIIIINFFSSPQEIIDKFDISVCQVVTAGNEWIMGEHTAQDLHAHNLRFVNGYRPDSLKRMIKYWTYGYKPVPGTLAAIQANPETTWNHSFDEIYSDAF